MEQPMLGFDTPIELFLSLTKTPKVLLFRCPFLLRHFSFQAKHPL